LNRKMTTNSPMTSSPFIRRIEIKSLSQGLEIIVVGFDPKREPLDE